MSKYRFTFHSDPGHGWLQVTHKQLLMSGIADKISMYSYMDHDYAYLEEDCDAPLFLKQLDDHKITYSFDERHTNRDHWIRNRPSYKFIASPFAGVGQ